MTLAEAIERAQQQDDPYIEGLQVAGEAIDERYDLQFFEFHHVELEHCSLCGARLAKASFYDCTFVECDFSNADLKETYFARCTLMGCKLEGAQLTKAFFRSTRLTDCMGRYGNWGEATLESVALSGCNMREAFLNEVRLKRGTRFEHCDLERADFFRTRLRGIDLSTCNIAGIMVSDTKEELRGMLIAAEQAVDLVGLLGVRVVD